jgi:hypothetical protein
MVRGTYCFANGIMTGFALCVIESKVGVVDELMLLYARWNTDLTTACSVTSTKIDDRSAVKMKKVGSRMVAVLYRN